MSVGAGSVSGMAATQSPGLAGPTSTGPTSTGPTSTVPTSTVPTSTVPTSTVPTSTALPGGAVPASPRARNSTPRRACCGRMPPRRSTPMSWRPLARADDRARPPSWKLSPQAVVTYLLGGATSDGSRSSRRSTSGLAGFDRGRGRDAGDRPGAAAARRSRHREDVGVRAPGGGDLRRLDAAGPGHERDGGGGDTVRVELPRGCLPRSRGPRWSPLPS